MSERRTQDPLSYPVGTGRMYSTCTIHVCVCVRENKHVHIYSIHKVTCTYSIHCTAPSLLKSASCLRTFRITLSDMTDAGNALLTISILSFFGLSSLSWNNRYKYTCKIEVGCKHSSPYNTCTCMLFQHTEKFFSSLSCVYA